MHAIANTVKSGFGTRSFFTGLGLALLFYCGILLWSFFDSGQSLEQLEKKLASETISILRGDQIALALDANDIQAGSTPAAEEDITDSQDDSLNETALLEENSKEDFPSHEKGEPIAGLFETTQQGYLLPIIRKSDNLTPFHAYKAPFHRKSGYSLISLVVDDFGLSASDYRLLNELPSGISMVVSPYADDALEISKSANKSGHETWMKMPLETLDFPNHDPGPRAILRRASLSANQSNLKWVMQQSEVYAGIAAYTDMAFSNSNPVTNNITREVFGRGLGFFEINSDGQSQIRDIAQRQNAPYGKNDLVIGTAQAGGNFENTLDLLENIARSRGNVIAVLPPYPEIINAIAKWSETLDLKSIQLAPLSAVILDRTPEIAKATQIHDTHQPQ